MAIKVSLIGHGAVGSIHVDKLAAEPGVVLWKVFGRKYEKASAFASAHGMKGARRNIGEVVSGADVAIVCSPSELHFQQAYECLDRGVHTLVELPPCFTVAEAESLGELARRRGVVLGCAHTSRFLAPYALIEECVRKELLGPIQEFTYTRHHQLRERSWADNALLHHAAHAIDLVSSWFGGLEPIGCVAVPDSEHAQTVATLSRLPSGGAASVTVSYTSRLPHIRMLLVGEHHTLEAHGFTHLRSDLPDLKFTGDAQEVYEQAIGDQDRAFLRSCQRLGNYVPWEETLQMVRMLDQFQALARAAGLQDRGARRIDRLEEQTSGGAGGE